ncbi:hypothetical protein L1987_02805 [Smallanthus sonchifolius]|uniref:Uncharacterized protein n=1 Tax=Smallanthus sonchifolius TaxID=185202 RepID=A0ACB9K8V6_9ASTR|nr:hypothetical protein L1987_02805 [Smallanthus sonchifolius]
MRLMKRLAGFLGIGNHEVNKDSEEETDANPNSTEETHHYVDTNLRRKGFSVPVQVPVDKAHKIGPILVPCPAGDGGVQGLQWYTSSLKIDEDGDVADEFLEEVFHETVANAPQKTRSEFQVKLTTKPAKAKDPCLSRKGTVQHTVKYHGRLQLVG